MAATDDVPDATPEVCTTSSLPCTATPTQTHSPGSGNCRSRRVEFTPDRHRSSTRLGTSSDTDRSGDDCAFFHKALLTLQPAQSEPRRRMQILTDADFPQASGGSSGQRWRSLPAPASGAPIAPTGPSRSDVADGLQQRVLKLSGRHELDGQWVTSTDPREDLRAAEA
jgi:hypothetical protein